MTSVPVGPGRTGHQTASWKSLRVSTLVTLAVLLALSTAGVFFPPVVFFAIGAGAGYSLSGSV